MKLRRQAGFTVTEVVVSLVILMLIGVSAAGALRVGVRTLGGAQQGTGASAAINELHEALFALPIDDPDGNPVWGSEPGEQAGFYDDLDDYDNITLTPFFNGGDLPGCEALDLAITVLPVDDDDPSITVQASASDTRLVTVAASFEQRPIMEASWLATRH